MYRILAFIIGAAIVALACVGTPFLLISDTYTLNPTPTPILTMAELRAQAITPTDLDRRTEQYIGRVVKLNGQITQVLEERNDYTLLIDVDGMTVMAMCGQCRDRPLVGDYILLYGTVQGRQAYETVLGASMTVPLVHIEQYSLAP